METKFLKSEFNTHNYEEKEKKETSDLKQVGKYQKQELT